MTADNAKLREDLMREEGWRPDAYRDSEGWLTIGYGRLIDGRKGGGITLQEGRMLLDNDILKLGPELDRAFPWWRGLPEPQARALCHMLFQLGLPNLSGFTKMLGFLQSGDFDFAADEALNSKWAVEQTPARARRVADLMRTPTPTT